MSLRGPCAGTHQHVSSNERSVWENGGEGTGGGGVMRVLETLLRLPDGIPVPPLKVAADIRRRGRKVLRGVQEL